MKTNHLYTVLYQEYEAKMRINEAEKYFQLKDSRKKNTFCRSPATSLSPWPSNRHFASFFN